MPTHDVTPVRQRIEAGIAALEAQRAILGDAAVDTAVAALRAQLGAMDAPAAAEQTRKQVTVLFLDVVGSTTLSQHLDAEDVHAIMDGVLERCTQIVGTHRGKVLKYAGDSLLAVFGAGEAREDDPELAVRAGLDLLAEGLRQREWVRQQFGYDHFNVRVGVHTGGVLLGGGVDAESSIRGMTVNVAARMEQTAPSGALRISRDTYGHVRGVFDVDEQPPLLVKGRDEPIVTYLVRGAKPRTFRVASRGMEGVETRMIGRDAELAQLQDAFLAVCCDRRLRAITVVADAGMGKSRLLHEFGNWAQARQKRFHLFQGRADPQTRGRPYGLLRDTLAWRLQIGDGDSMATARKKVEDGIAPLFRADEGEAMAIAHAHLAGHLIGVDFGDSPHVRGIREDGKQIRNRGFHAIAQMFRRMAQGGDLPVVLLQDDLHFADDGTLDFLEYLERVDRDIPLLVLGLARPELFERRPQWNDAGGVTRVVLAPLDGRASHALAGELLGELGDIPAVLRDLITGTAGGNPFFMEELVKMLVDERAIDTRTRPWTVDPARLQDLRVPPTLTGVLQARLDSLAGDEKQGLQQASVIGMVFWDQALAAIDPRAPEALPGLMRRELVVPGLDATFERAREFTFKHQLLHQVTYETVLRHVRRSAHAQTAAWLAGLTGARANDFLGVTAEHYERAGDIANAIEFFTRAAESAASRHAHDALLGYVQRALALCAGAGQHDQARWRLLDVRERTFDILGRRVEQMADIEALRGLADALDDDARRGEAVYRRCDIALRTGDWATQAAAAREAMALARAANSDELRLRAQHRLATAITRLGDYEGGRAMAEQGLAETRKLGLRVQEARFLNALAIIVGRRDVVAFLAFNEQDLALNRELGDRLTEAVALCNQGVCYSYFGDYAQARQMLEQGLSLSRSVGHRSLEAAILCNLSSILLKQGESARARETGRSALALAEEGGEPHSQYNALYNMAEAGMAQGAYAEAIELFSRSRAIGLSVQSAGISALAGMARAALAQEKVAEAMRHVETIITELQAKGTLGGGDDEHESRHTCYTILQRAGDSRAATMLDGAYAGVMQQAGKITDARLRAGFLASVKEHREIVAAWEHQSRSAATAS
ncbi:MAG: adenylate/guanylate cyclase domain-containing protein [Casimicrobiaceae bacterium]